MKIMDLLQRYKMSSSTGPSVLGGNGMGQTASAPATGPLPGGNGTASSEGQTYCLRWNNHKSNLVDILNTLIKMESYVDCTLVVDNQVQFKAHRVVLAANSPYFQSILQDVPMDHCSILFPGIKADEMQALLVYMYTGEVNVTQSEIPKIMKIAEQLEVKGLFDMADLKEKFNKFDDSMGRYTPAPAASYQQSKETASSTNITGAVGSVGQLQSSPVITSTNVTPTPSSNSPPYIYKSPYSSMFLKSPGTSTSERHSHQWPISPHMQPPISSAAAAAAAEAMLSSAYENAPDMNPLKRKKLSSLSSMLMSRDTPILRNVLAQPNAADSSQSMPLVCPPPAKSLERIDKTSSDSCNGSDYGMDKVKKYDEPHSPYGDKSFEDDGMDCPSGFPGDSRIASYVPQQQQKPEWKRYKQYTRSDILSAIECVRNGMSALQASRKFGVPSRTLYDKVKKLGITTGRPMNRALKRSPNSSGSPSGFPFGLSGAPSHSYMKNDMLMHDTSDRESDREHNLPPSISHPAAALLDPSFLQHAFEGRGGDTAGREALHAMALAAVAHAAVNGISTSPSRNGTARSPSPSLAKYMRPHSPALMRERDHEMDRMEHERGMREREHERELHERDLHDSREHEEIDDLEDRVEDLSMGNKCKDNTSSPISQMPSQSTYSSHRMEMDRERDRRQEQREREIAYHRESPSPPSSHHLHSSQQLTDRPIGGGVIVPPMTMNTSNGSEDYCMDLKRPISPGLKETRE